MQPCSLGRARDIGYLLKYVSEYIIDKELIRYRNRPWAEKIARYVAEHPGQPIRLRDMADLIGRSASFITHHFRTEFGCSPKEYVWQTKMEKARSMIEGGNRVQTTADELGFYDAFHFSKRFKAYWGSPPSRFRPTAMDPVSRKRGSVARKGMEARS
jgi:iron complex transport system substrate-binding protein